ncbi:NAD(P)-dependent oxidoreductase [Microbacterium sp. LRZ72]|uniref:NAD(P)-dependent oxidoreductase n=1 Tax=Microbacterium sp. LRZ72 TaxID=2942481 RepID=UPI0029A2695E|nr:NAD(P)-dependent oxidoreductase [Microbacterium sp. LRZ72]MDX2376349.1 NAD(P)-dependent oxidoreductase [Microbacterium sp. LRZ72]
MSAGGEIVGFIGLGTMGAPMATNIAAVGYDMRVYDADPEAATAVADRIGATAVADVAGLAECTIVVLMLPTSAIVRSVLLTPEGGSRIPFESGAVVVDMSSSDPTETVETGRALAAAGVAMVDAPVSGARERAVAGTLAIMLGTDDVAAAERAVPVIEAMSRAIYRTGKLGTGHAMKALNNFVAGAAFVATSEALVAGQRFGLDPQLMVDVFNDSTGQSFSTTHVFGPHVVDRRFASGFALPLITKDVRIAHELQRAVGHDAPVCAAVTASLEDALEALGPVDHTAAYTHWESR